MSRRITPVLFLLILVATAGNGWGMEQHNDQITGVMSSPISVAGPWERGEKGEFPEYSLLPFFNMTTVEADTVDVVPGQTLFLEPNIPNPFSSTTIIAYSLDRETTVTLRVFDAFYNEVATLIDDLVQVEGRYEITFNPEGELASGMYFFSLTTSEGVLTRRMLLLK